MLSPTLGFDLPTAVRSYDMGGGEQDLSPSPLSMGKGPLSCVTGRRTVPLGSCDCRILPSERCSREASAALLAIYSRGIWHHHTLCYRNELGG